MSETFEWQSRIRLVEEVAQVLRRRIYSGHYPPGKPLRQVEIAEDLKVSRTPLREAFRVLEREGLVTAETARGVCVASADRKQLIDAYLFREVIDGLAARSAAQLVGVKVTRRLRSIIECQRKALDPWLPGDYTQANVDFHKAIIEFAKNEYLMRQLPIVHMTSQVFRPDAFMKQERAAAAISEHIEIAEAIASGDGDRAEMTARQHIRRTIEGMLSAA
jgi:DNA-binding GntR family transcriptional regulator